MLLGDVEFLTPEHLTMLEGTGGSNLDPLAIWILLGLGGQGDGLSE